jgi:tetratricopeptide (TPR) repeat protein
MAKKKDQKQRHDAPYRRPPTTRKHWLNEGNTHYRAEHCEEALAAFEQAILLNPRNLEAHAGKIRALAALKRYKKMVAAMKQVCYWFMH